MRKNHLPPTGLDMPGPDAALPARRLAQLIECHSSSIDAFLRRQGVASADVDDVKQRVWLTALRWSARLKPGSERAFLFVVARREAGHARRSYRRRAEVGGVEFDTLQSEELLADEIVARRERLQQAHTVLEAMESELRDLFVALESREASARDVARELGIPLGTAKSRLRRARQECRAACGEHAATDESLAVLRRARA
jgi:RNA polymerase sigma factor (sigma-70 family)